MIKNMNVKSICDYLKQNKLNFNDDVLNSINIIKSKAVDNADEDLANYMWCLQQIYIIQKKYISAYLLLKEKIFEEAWLLFDRIEISIISLMDNFDMSVNKYNIEFILNNIRNFQKLYPYEYFLSRESIIKSEKCTICGRKVTLRNACEHKIGKLYNGEICLHEITDFEFKCMALVKNPFDKFSYIQIQDKEYNYEMIEILSQELKSPYEKWHIEDSKIIKPEFRKIGRNEKCPCGSNKKYKKCCMDTEKELMSHHKIIFESSYKHKNMSPKIFSTYK